MSNNVVVSFVNFILAARYQAVGRYFEFAVTLATPLQGAVIMQATTADLAFAAVCDLEIHKSDNCKPKHIMLVINCSKIM